MLKCSLILYAHNNEGTISKVIDSLKKINGNFRREFIIVDDGSTDDTLNIIKKSTKDLSRSTIITQEHLGSSISINKALSLAKADYIYFVSAIDETHKDIPQELIDACIKEKVDVAFSSKVQNNHKKKIPEATLINDPLKEVLLDRNPNIRNIGGPGSLISYNLIMRIDGADEEIYTYRPYIALKCARFSKFVQLRDPLEKEEVSLNCLASDVNFDSYNDLLAIHNFIKEEPAEAEKYKNELVLNLYKSIEGVKNKATYLSKYLLVKYINKYNLDAILNWYDKEIKQLF